MLRQRLSDRYTYSSPYYMSTPKTHNPKKEKPFLSEWRIAAAGLCISLIIIITNILYSHREYIQAHLIEKHLVSYEVLTEQGEVMLEYTWKNVAKYSKFWLPLLCGFFTTYAIWIMVYLDSNIPGVDPPSPFSPKKYRERSGHTFHLNYIFAILMGIVVFIKTFWSGWCIEY